MTKGSSAPVAKCRRSAVVHEPHEWYASRWWWAKPRLCPGITPGPPPMYRGLYEDAREVILSVWRLHSDFRMVPDEPGFGAVGREFYCHHCRMEWPCDTARLVMDHGTTPHNYEPLRLVSGPTDEADFDG